MSKRVALAVALILFNPVASGTAQASAQSDNVTLDLRSVNGSGCPRGTTGVAVSQDATAFTITYAAFTAPGGTVKNCQLVVDVHVPRGLTFAVYQVDNRGYAYLRPGTTGKNSLTSYFSGMSSTVRSVRTLQGPYDDVWQTTQTMESLDWAPCNVDRYLNVNNTLRVSGSSGSYMDMHSTDASVSTVFHVQWKSCD